MDTLRINLITNKNIDLNTNKKIYNQEKPYYSEIGWGRQWLNGHMDLNGQIPFRTVYKPDTTISFEFTFNRPFNIITLDVPKKIVLLLYEDIFNEFVCNNEIFLGDIYITGKGINYTKQQIIDSWEATIYNNKKKSDFILKNKTIIGMIPYFYSKWIYRIVHYPLKKDNENLIYYLKELE